MVSLEFTNILQLEKTSKIINVSGVYAVIDQQTGHFHIGYTHNLAGAFYYILKGGTWNVINSMSMYLMNGYRVSNYEFKVIAMTNTVEEAADIANSIIEEYDPEFCRCRGSYTLIMSTPFFSTTTVTMHKKGTTTTSGVMVQSRHYSTGTRLSATSVTGQNSIYWEKHQKVKNYVKTGKTPNVDIMNEVLFETSVVNQKHLDLCANIIENSKKADLPISGTPSSVAFTPIGGVNNPYNVRTTAPKVPGCYQIIGPDGSNYVGQAAHLGKRVREHGNGSITSSIKNIENKELAKVEVYLLPEIESYHGLTIVEFLSVLELYLFITFKPTINKSYVPTPGFIHNWETIEKIKLVISKPVYIYKLNGDNMTLLFTAQSGRQLMRDLGVSNSTLSNVFRRSNGWYRDTLLFTLESTDDIPTMNFEEFKAEFKLTKAIVRKSVVTETDVMRSRTALQSANVILTNTKTGEILEYQSIREASDAVGITRQTLKKYKGQVYKNYHITISEPVIKTPYSPLDTSTFSVPVGATGSKVTLRNIETDEILLFNSITSAGEAIGSNRYAIRRHNGKIFQGYLISIEENKK